MPMALQYANEAGTPDYVDYGAEPDAHGADATAAEAPRLVIELQRSFDLWDRSWPSLPIAALWVHAGEVSGEMATVLGASLGQSVGVLDPALALPGFEQATAATGVRSAVLPLAGALRRGTPGSR